MLVDFVYFTTKGVERLKRPIDPSGIIVSSFGNLHLVLALCMLSWREHDLETASTGPMWGVTLCVCVRKRCKEGCVL